MISRNAYKIMELWKQVCKNNSGQEQRWYGHGNKHFEWKPSTKDFKDGSLVGTILSILPTGRKISSSFRIDGDGTVVRAPAFLRKASAILEKALTDESNQMRVHE